MLIGLGPLHDNSFLTHLATGRLILARHAVPSTDPYSFTAHGHPWVVQSWFASVLYAVAEKLGGLTAVRALLGVTTGLLAALVWRLTASARALVPRLVIAALAIGVGVGAWVERPLTLGLLALATVLLVGIGTGDPRWLVPVMWFWVNTHGSFPLGLLLLALLAAGRWLDREAPRVELRALGWAALGTLAGAVNPVGPKLLLFPLELLHHTEAFRAVVEWQPPKFEVLEQRLFLVQLVVAVGLLLLRNRQWRVALPLVVFAGLAFTSARNVAPASLVLVPLMGMSAMGFGSVDGRERRAANRPAIFALAVLGVVLAASALAGPDTNLAAYPTKALAWMADHHLVGHGTHARVVTRDFVGNLLEARYGADAHAYIDDRVDMYPLSLVRDYQVLRKGQPSWPAVLARARADAVLWNADSPLARALSKSRSWSIVYRDADWIVAEPVRPGVTR